MRILLTFLIILLTNNVYAGYIPSNSSTTNNDPISSLTIGEKPVNTTGNIQLIAEDFSLKIRSFNTLWSDYETLATESWVLNQGFKSDMRPFIVFTGDTVSELNSLLSDSSSTGAIIQLLDKVYTFDSYLAIPGNITLQGFTYGINTKLDFSSSTFSGSCIYINGDNITIQNLVIQDDGSNSELRNGITTTSNSVTKNNFKLLNTSLLGINNFGIYTDATSSTSKSSWLISNNTIRSFSGAMYLHTRVNNHIIEKNKMVSTKPYNYIFFYHYNGVATPPDSYGIGVNGVFSLQLLNNLFDSNYSAFVNGVFLSSSSSGIRYLIQGNIIYGNTTPDPNGGSLVLGGSQTSLNAYINNNSFSHAGDRGLVSSWQRVRLINNHFEGFNNVPTALSIVSTASSGFFISQGNSFSRPHTAYSILSGSAFYSIESNWFFNKNTALSINYASATGNMEVSNCSIDFITGTTNPVIDPNNRVKVLSLTEGLPKASSDNYGFIKVGNSLSINNGVLDLPTTGVTAGTYTQASITVDTEGRVTSASSGSSGGSGLPTFIPYSTNGGSNSCNYYCITLGGFSGCAFSYTSQMLDSPFDSCAVSEVEQCMCLE